MQLTANEELELRYMQALGFKWIARHEIGSVEIFKEEPVLESSIGFTKHGYEIWVIEGNYPINDFSLMRRPEIAKHEYITFEDGPLEIDKLLRENGDIPLVEPKGTGL